MVKQEDSIYWTLGMYILGQTIYFLYVTVLWHFIVKIELTGAFLLGIKGYVPVI